MIKLAYEVGVNETDGSAVSFLSTILDSWIFPIFGAIALAGVVYAGVLFITAAGNPDKVSRARRALLYSITAIVIAVLAIAIVKGLKSILTNDILK